MGLDNFPVCGHVEVKADVSNIRRLVSHIKRYVSDVQSYLMQWKAVYGSPRFLCLLKVSSDMAEQATYDIARVAEAEWVQEIPAAGNRVHEAVASLLNYTVHQQEELTAFHNEMFPRYSISTIDDEILPEDSVPRIGSS